jgi:hypothetical protein
MRAGDFTPTVLFILALHGKGQTIVQRFVLFGVGPYMPYYSFSPSDFRDKYYLLYFTKNSINTIKCNLFTLIRMHIYLYVYLFVERERERERKNKIYDLKVYMHGSQMGRKEIAVFLIFFSYYLHVFAISSPLQMALPSSGTFELLLAFGCVTNSFLSHSSFFCL